MILECAAQTCGGRVVSILEGGPGMCDADTLGECVVSHVMQLMTPVATPSRSSSPITTSVSATRDAANSWSAGTTPAGSDGDDTSTIDTPAEEDNNGEVLTSQISSTETSAESSPERPGAGHDAGALHTPQQSQL